VTRETKNIHPGQTLVSVFILSFLVIIGVGIFLVQYRTNPAVLQTAAVLTAADHSTASLPQPETESLIQLPEGTVPLTPPEMFAGHNLSDKINGKAELYLSSGFVRLHTQRFQISRSAKVWMEAFVYDMGSGQNAFSVFSAQRREDAEPSNLTQNAYRTSNALFWVHGPYYVEVIASEASELAFQPMQRFAENFIRNARSDSGTMAEIELFPKQDLLAGSITLISSNVFGYDRLNQTYTAEYAAGEGRLMAFLSHRPTFQEARELASVYGEFLINFGGRSLESDLPIKEAQLVEILETYEIIFSCGAFLAGVREATDMEPAKNLAIRLYHRLKEANCESRNRQ
jgi:hypothetical protein